MPKKFQKNANKNFRQFYSKTLIIQFFLLTFYIYDILDGNSLLLISMSVYIAGVYLKIANTRFHPPRELEAP